jgi:hypothetical protein
VLRRSAVFGRSRCDPFNPRAPWPAALNPSADYHWLVSDRAEPYLAAIDSEADRLAAASFLRSKLTAGQAHLVLEQVALRWRARKKFAAADQMFFTQLGLEQATDEWTAAYKARRFADGQPAVDFCCGIGGDLLALATRGPVVGVDLDPVAALFARTNLDRCRSAARAPQSPVCSATVEVVAAADYPLESGAAWHVDPDRRPAGRRTTRAELHDPPPEVIDGWRARAPSGAIKLAPAAEVPLHWSAEAELEWISFARECRQLVAWFGGLAREPGRRRASRVDRESGAVCSVLGTAGVEPPVATKIGRYVFEPDPAVLAADLTGSLAEQSNLAAIAPGACYLTADVPVSNWLLAGFEVLEVIPLDMKRLKRLVRERGIGQLEVKQRGLAHDPQAVARQLRVPGEHSATLLLTRCGKSALAVLARRLTRDDSHTTPEHDVP